MDFLDLLDLHTTDDKSNRVRSWYLYEQYKSLEKSQLDAAKKLKHKSYQDRILYRELSERRARRQLSEQFDIRHGESRVERTLNNDPSRTPYTSSTDSFFESLCEQEDVVKEKDEDAVSQHSETRKFYDEYKSSDDKIDSYSESINSIIENTDVKENIAEDIKDELEIVKKNIAEIINMQMETEQECLEKYTEISDEKSEEALTSKEKCDVKRVAATDKYYPRHDSGVTAIWTKLVAFSYNLMQMNRGNCYYDYSSQFLTGVLAFDVLRKGINRMCYILQPYVSPIKFASDDCDAPSITNVTLNPNCVSYDPSSHISNPKCCPIQTLNRKEKKYRSFQRKYRSEDKWQSRYKYSFEDCSRDTRARRASEPWRSVAEYSCGRHSFKDKLSCNNTEISQPDKCSSFCKCIQFKKAINPIIKLSRHIDMILQEIED